MKYLVGYWCIGCVLFGLGQGARFNRCPNEKVDVRSAFIFVATWPMIFGMGWTLRDTTPPACDVQS